MALLSEAVVGSVNLRRADLKGAKLDMVNLTQASLQHARYDRTTIWPDGFDPAQTGATLVGRPANA